MTLQEEAKIGASYCMGCKPNHMVYFAPNSRNPQGYWYIFSRNPLKKALFIKTPSYTALRLL